jgi:hypothetical protein
MAILIKFPNGSTETIAEAATVDWRNFHEGMYDFYDKNGALIRQISMHSGIDWELIDEPKIDRENAAKNIF